MGRLAAAYGHADQSGRYGTLCPSRTAQALRQRIEPMFGFKEGRVRELVAEEIKGKAGADAIKAQLDAAVRGPVRTDLAAEIARLKDEYRAAVDKIVADNKAALHRKLNDAYETHALKLRTELSILEDRLAQDTPVLVQRLERIEAKAAEVSERQQKLSAAPKQEFAALVAQHRAELTEAAEQARKASDARARALVARVEKQLGELVEAKLHEALLRAVREHVRAEPFTGDGLTNKQLAAARGISLRAAKRLRRVRQECSRSGYGLR